MDPIAVLLKFGFLIPVFFVASGVRLDLQGLIVQPSALLRVPVFLLALLLIPDTEMVTVGINGELAQRGTVLRDRDEITMFSPMEGG